MASGLAQYIQKTYKDFKQNKSEFEAKCRMNENTFKGIDNKRWKAEEGEGWRCDAYYKLVKVKIFAAIAMISDFLFPGGEVPFTLKESEYEDVIDDSSEETAIDKMKNLIKDQQRYRKAGRENAKKLLSKALYGMCWSKYNIAPVETDRYEKVVDEAGVVRYQLVNEEKKIPGHEYRSVHSIFWDMEEDDVQEMSAIIERDLMSPFSLRQKKGKKFYIDAHIDRVINENSVKKASVDDSESLPPALRDAKNRKKNIDTFEFWGRVPSRIVDEFEAEVNRLASLSKRGRENEYLEGLEGGINDVDTSDGDEVEVFAQMSGGEVVRYTRRPPNKRPYKKSVWEELLDETTGNGIADNLEDMNGLLNGFFRAFVDNKALSANTILAFKERYLQPGALDTIKPGMKLPISDDCDDARRAIQQVIIQDVGDSLISGIKLLFDGIEDVSQIPQILHAFTKDAQNPDTAFQSNQLEQNSTKYLGKVIRNFDEFIIEPEVKDIYKYNMEDPDVDPASKCDCLVHANGFSSFQNKVIKAQSIMQMVSMIMSDRSGILSSEVKIRPHLEEIYRAKDLDPVEFLKTDKEKEQDQVQAEYAKQKAMKQLQAEKELETQSKMAIDTNKAELDAQAKEDEFQRGIIKDELNGQGKER